MKPAGKLGNKTTTQSYLKKYNLDKFKPKFNAKSVQASNAIKNYYLKDDKNNNLLIFQLGAKTKLKYSDIEKHLGIPADSITEASQKMIEDTIGVKEEGIWTTATHQPRVQNVIVYKEKSLMGTKAKDLEGFSSSLNPWRAKPHNQMIELLSHPNIK